MQFLKVDLPLFEGKSKIVGHGYLPLYIFIIPRVDFYRGLVILESAFPRSFGIFGTGVDNAIGRIAAELRYAAWRSKVPCRQATWSGCSFIAPKIRRVRPLG